MRKEFFEEKIQKLKKIADTEFEKGNIDKALRTIHICASILYEFNQTYTDDELEKLVVSISNRILGENRQEILKQDSDVILFYDGFGLDNRGLAKIYLKSLCLKRKLIYVTYAKRKDYIPEIIKLLDFYNAKKIFIEEGSFVNQIKELNRIVQSQRPEKLIMYTLPNDVVVTTVFSYYTEKIVRYQINLTDHAFWLGKCAMDKCIEFRDYGANISYLHRNIEKEKIYKLPFYPQINYDVPFEGYPFDIGEEIQPKVIFSGGALYKTIGGENKYYQMVEHILTKYPDSLFWYAGYGERKEFDKLIKKFPNRVYLTKERRDLYQVLRHSFFYLSTYPISGGLMFQYAAMAERIPITLKYDQDTEGFLLQQSELNIEFDSLEKLYDEVDKLFSDADYKRTREKLIKTSVISEDDFSSGLEKIFTEEKNSYEISIKDVDVEYFRQEYWNRHTQSDLLKMFASKEGVYLIKYFPIEYIVGLIAKLIEMVKKIISIKPN